MADASQSPVPPFRRRLLGYAPGQVDAFLARTRDEVEARSPDAEVARAGRQMADVLRRFATSMAAAEQEAAAEADRVRQEAVEASAAIRADAEAKAALLLEKAEAIRGEAQAAAELAARDAEAQRASLRQMAHELVDTVLRDTGERLAELVTTGDRLRRALDEAEAGLRQARTGVAALPVPDTGALLARAHEVVDLITLEGAASERPVGPAIELDEGPVPPPAAVDLSDGALSSIDAVYQRSTP